MRFGVLGPLLVHDAAGDERPVAAAQHRRLLAILLTRANQAISFDELADAMWDGEPPPAARPTLRNYVRLLRQRLGPELAGRLVTRAPGYLIEVGEDELDSWRFTRLCHHGGNAIRARAWSTAADTLTAALALWRGPAFADVASRLVQDTEVAHLTNLRLQALEWRIEAGLQLGRHDDLVDELRRLTRRHPLRERFAEQLMVALYRSGRQGDALAAYAQAWRVSQRELGVEPGPALREMQRRILAADAALVLRPEDPPVAAVRPAQLPPDVRGFAGRADALAELDVVLDDAPGSVAIAAVSGTAGVGKTALAVHWAHRAADRFPDGQLYLNLRGFDPGGAVMSPAEATRTLLDSLGLPSDRVPSSAEAQAALYRSLLNGRRMLILLDNARDAEQVRPLVPGAPGCLLLVTSRDQLTGVVVAGDAHSVTLGVLGPAEAVDLLARRLGKRRVAAEPAAAAAIADACAGLPLALGVVAARAAAHPGFPLAALAAELREARGVLDALDGGDPVTDVRAVFSWSYGALSDAAARMFRLLGLHGGPDITVAAATSLAGGDARRALAELSRAHLVAEHAPGRFSSHDLLRAYATELVHGTEPAAETATERDAAVRRILDHYLRTARAADALIDPHRVAEALPPPPAGVVPEPIADHARAVAWFSAEHAVLLTAVVQAAAAGRQRHTVQLAWALMTFLDRRGYWHDLDVTQRLALDVADGLGDAAAGVQARRALARAYGRTGHYDEALRHLREALAMAADLGNRAGEASTHLNLAWVLELKGEYAAALGHAERALELQAVSGRQARHANALNTVGWLLVRVGEDERAVDHCREALRLFEEIGDRYGQGATWDSLGFALHRLGRLDDAATAYTRAADLLHALGYRFNEATARRQLGEVHVEAGRPAEAHAAWWAAVALFDELGHPDAEEVRSRLLAAVGERPGLAQRTSP